MRVLPPLILLAACDPPPRLVDDAPGSDVDDASLPGVLALLYRDAEQPPGRLAALVLRLEDRIAAEGVDLTAPSRKDREFTLPPLTADHLGEVIPPDGADPEKQASVVVFGRGTRGFDDAVAVQREPNQVCVESRTTVFYQRAFTTDDACLQDGSCDVARSVAEVRKELSILAAGWYDFHKDFRRLTLDDGRRVLLGRGWIPRVYELERGGTAVQTYTLEVWIERGDVVDRTYALWGELDIGLGPAAMLDLTSDALHENLERQDLFVAGPPFDWCRQDRDRPYDRPGE